MANKVDVTVFECVDFLKILDIFNCIQNQQNLLE